MTRLDWTYVGITMVLTEAIDSFLASDEAKNMNLKNRQQFVNRLIADFFRKYKENTGIDHLKLPIHTGVLDLLDTKPKKTKKLRKSSGLI